LRAINLPRPPLQSITSVSTFDDADAETTYAASNYFVDTASEPGRLVLRKSAGAPTTTRAANGIKIVFVSGYGDDFSTVPEPMRQGILRTVAWQYQNRGDCDADEAARNSGAQVLWHDYRVLRV
jgi:uncharacterized phiE125 gp8 family phage protein